MGLATISLLGFVRRAGISIATRSVHLVTIFHTSKSQARFSNPDESAPSAFSRRPKLKQPEAVYNFVRRAGGGSNRVYGLETKNSSSREDRSVFRQHGAGYLPRASCLSAGTGSNVSTRGFPSR